MALNPIKADNLTNRRHGFFTRSGGTSTGIYAGLNCGKGSNDDTENVHKNRVLVAETFDLGEPDLVSVHQVHSADTVHVIAPFDGETPKCDSMVTATPGIALGVLSADCAPVLFEDSNAGVVGAAHSGWRGAIGGVLQSTVDAMVELGASHRNIAACIGPCISQKAYEVGPEFVEEFIQHDHHYAAYFGNGAGDRSLFDLPRFALDRLRAAGVENVAWTGHCTFSDPNTFYSYRRTCHEGQPDYGRLISVICV